MNLKPLRVAIVAGEASGDVLAAGLIKEFKRLCPHAVFEGIAGPNMLEQGCSTLFDLEELSVMGLVEVLSKIRRLLHIRKTVLQHFTDNPPDVFIGVDAPDFNLPLERKLKASGVKTVHYVSPTVWAWREKRIIGIGAATNLVLSIFPFEKRIYDQYGFPCQFIGHTMADDIPIEPDKHLARKSLSGVDVEDTETVLAILPGSRGSEVKMLLAIFLLSAVEIAKRVGTLRVLIPAVNEVRKQQIVSIIDQMQQQHGLSETLNIDVTVRQSRNVMIASDGIILASGTASLEAMLCKRPMVVAYRLKWLTHQMMKVLYKAKYFALPNLLADEPIVPELLQEDVNPHNIAETLAPMMISENSQVKETFVRIHEMLKVDADKQAAKAVYALLDNTANDC